MWILVLALFLWGCNEPAVEPAKQPAVATKLDPSVPYVPMGSVPKEPAKEPAKLDEPDMTGPVPTGIPREALKYRNTIIRETRFYWTLSGMKPDVFFAQIHQESRFKATAASKFASGLAQFTPATAAGYNKAYPKDLQELCPVAQGCPLDPHWAIRAGIIYDRDMYRVYKFAIDTENQWGFTLAAYNGGAGWIDRELKVCKLSDVCRSAAYFPDAKRDLPLGVQDKCGQSTPGRADWACKENQHYPNVILFKHRPIYTKWLGPLNHGVGVTQ